MCTVCGYTKSRAMADANMLGLQQELESGFYTCCQIVQWADEQWLAWLDAAQQDRARVGQVGAVGLEPPEDVFVCVRLRQPKRGHA